MTKAGHNSQLSETDKKALFFHHLRIRMGHDAKVKEANADKKAAGKLAQADNIVLGDLDYAIKAISADDKATVTDRFLAHGEVLSWLNVIPGFQSDLLRDRAPAIERIEGEGELAGLAGKDPESGYDKGSDEDAAWMRGWDKGQKFMRDNLQSAMEKRNAEADRDHGDNPEFPDQEAA